MSTLKEQINNFRRSFVDERKFSISKFVEVESRWHYVELAGL